MAKFQNLIWWGNYPVSDATWEPAENILDQRLLDEFQGRYYLSTQQGLLPVFNTTNGSSHLISLTP